MGYEKNEGQFFESEAARVTFSPQEWIYHSAQPHLKLICSTCLLITLQPADPQLDHHLRDHLGMCAASDSGLVNHQAYQCTIEMEAP